MIIKIAFCDDDVVYCTILETLLRKFQKKHPELILKCHSFYNGLTLFERLMQNTYDLVFMDIEFKDGINGMQIIHQLQQQKQYAKTEYIFISNHTKYALKLFDFFPLGFIQKGKDLEEQFMRIMEHYLTVISDRNTVCFDSSYVKIPIHQVLYFKCKEHMVYPCGNQLCDGFRLRVSFEEYCTSLERFGFIQISQSLCVNIAHIIRFTRKTVTLSNQESLPITEKYKSNFISLIKGIVL